MTAKPPAPKGIPASAVATVILLILAFVIGAILMQGDGDFGVPWLDELPKPQLDRFDPGPAGGDGAGPAEGGGQPDTCRKNCKDDNP